MAGHLEVLEQILEFKGQMHAFELIRETGNKNIILSNAQSFCNIIPSEFSTSGVVLVISPYVDRIYE